MTTVRRTFGRARALSRVCPFRTRRGIVGGMKNYLKIAPSHVSMRPAGRRRWVRCCCPGPAIITTKLPCTCVVVGRAAGRVLLSARSRRTIARPKYGHGRGWCCLERERDRECERGVRAAAATGFSRHPARRARGLGLAAQTVRGSDTHEAQRIAASPVVICVRMNGRDRAAV